MTTAAELDKIVEGPGTKADKARALFRLGCDRTDVVELLSMSYSQAHSVLKGMQSGQQPGSSPTASSTGRLQGRNRVADREGKTASAGQLHDHSSSGDRAGRPPSGGRGGALGQRPALRLSPSQTRFITQDGHVVIRVDKETGPECRSCGRRLNFSIYWLGFLHADSSADPTDLEDRYDDS